MKKEAPYDEVSIKQLFYGCNSAFTKLPIHHNINSRKSGAGKSYILILVSGYFPNRYVLLFVGMSDKALIHEQGIQVIIDEETDDTVSVDPIINDLKKKMGALEWKLENAKSQESKNKVLKKELKSQLKQCEKEIKNIYNKCEKLIILDNRIVLLLDTAQEGLYNTLMSMISQDTEKDQLYQFTDKQGFGKLSAAKNRLRGTPTLFTTQVIDDTRQVRYQEKNRRFIHVTPDTSSKKISSAKRLIGQKYGLLPEEYDQEVVSREDKERAKEIVSIIVDKLIDHSKLFKPKESGVKIPFAESISSGIGDDDTEWSMTVMDRLSRYLGVISKINMDSRPKFIDIETGKFYPISTFEDLKEALGLMEMAASSLRPYIADWYNRVFLPRYRELEGVPNAQYNDNGHVVDSEKYVGLTTQQLANRTFDVMGTPISTEAIRKQYLYPLSNLGIVNIVKCSINRNELICYPVEDGNIFSIFDNDRDLRLEIKKEYRGSYPDRKYLLEKAFRTFVNHDVKEGVQNSSKYRLVDHEGNSIAVEEMVDRYLNDPWTCFKTDKRYYTELEARALCMYDAPYPTRQENENNFYPPGCRRDLTKIQNNRVEDSSSMDDFELVPRSVMEIQLGIDKDWSITRIKEGSNTWRCGYKDCRIMGKVEAVRPHAINHEIAEIKERLKSLESLSWSKVQEELRKLPRDTVLEFQKYVENGSALETYILHALDDIERRGC